MWQFAPNSIHYLLSLWQRMVASVPYVKAIEPHLLETYTPEVTQAFVTSRLESVGVIMRYVTNIFFRLYLTRMSCFEKIFINFINNLFEILGMA